MDGGSFKFKMGKILPFKNNLDKLLLLRAAYISMGLNYFLPLIVLLVIIWSYYVYVIEFSINIVNVTWKRALFLCVCHVFFVPVVWSFFDIMLTGVAEVPEHFKLSDSEHDHFISYRSEERADLYLQEIVNTRNLVLYTCTSQKRIRYCMDCKQIKPDRAHHCSQCDICVLKMDHHCPWVNNCIGFHNYKSFVVFIMYLSLYIIYFIGCIFEDFLSAWEGHKIMKQKIHLVIGFSVGIFVGILSVFFYTYHLTLILRNETTIENSYPPYFYDDTINFDLGWKKNLEEVFGDTRFLWFIPVFSSSGTGDEFEVRQVAQH